MNPSPNPAMRRLAAALAGAAALLAGTLAHAADAYPTRPVRMVVPFPPGGTTDIFARQIGDRLSRALGQNVVIENRGGAGGNIGSDSVAKAEPDGYTILMGTVGTHAINPSLYRQMPYDALRDFAPVAFVAGVPNVLVVNPRNVKARTVQDFIAEAKGAKKTFNMASSGNGTSIHLSGEMFRQMTGVDLVHVPYRGSGPAVNDLVGGQVDLMFDNLPSSIEQIRAGTLSAIALTSAKRSPALPDIPTIAEGGVPGFEASSWFGLFAPAKTPREIVDKLNAEVRQALANPETQKRFADIGGEIRLYSPEEFGAFVRGELEKWAAVVKASGAKID
ncbi:Bug family tripartite tricarboxylate transporter substrate binding protein [Salinarimonas soli]|uniref:Tripartite tricarboxylate transporter substrate binding protein n=1 Tax=Salinarimonas soli TaxID=1638099 RepID=A0A5B2VCZ9_9HYPH|nr:tripartite tricarboxylate transporter substrate binding protein [Salinarimonas soli]KAA2236625.1 tripartite tricarboxylate transporter substrate binding protein [Salinarimonas soli]